MNNWYNYDFKEPRFFFSKVAQINFHMEHFRHDVKKAIEDNTRAIREQTQVQTNDAQAMRTNQTTLFGNLIKTIKSLFSKEKDSSVSGETFYEMVQRENNETQEYLEKYDNNSKYIANNTKTIGDNLDDIINKLEEIKSQDKTNSDKISTAISNLKLIVNVP